MKRKKQLIKNKTLPEKLSANTFLVTAIMLLVGIPASIKAGQVNIFLFLVITGACVLSAVCRYDLHKIQKEKEHARYCENFKQTMQETKLKSKEISRRKKRTNIAS